MARIVKWTTDAEGVLVKRVLDAAPADLPPPPRPANLSPRRFEWLLAKTGLDEVWDGVERHLQSSADPADRDRYASLRAARRARYFTLDDTLAMVAQFRPLVTQLFPGVDVSDAAIRAAWAQAEQY